MARTTSQTPQHRRKSSRPHHRIALYIGGASPRSQSAVACVRTVCDEHLAGRHELSVFDVYQQQRLASDSDIVVVPTLLISTGDSERRLVGGLTEDLIVNALATH